ncbi:MAG TPA: protein-disulfide reductase DsbD family protein [Oligoflexia bacterium]|nr:protein-disulfide reductase DsbD family protein [Oligoflexia bacterium]HMR24202.1 protein-disulfide reductase DsbD family protein [Oligoflexia bacterium]
MRKFLYVCLSLFLSSHAFAQSQTSQQQFKNFSHSKARLITQHTSIDPLDLQSSNLAFQIKLDPHWHTYWKNPGDSGAPVILNFSSNAENIQFGDILWPNPIRIDTPPLTSYAYENEVSLIIPITLSKPIPSGQTLNISLKAQWLVCKKECVPEFGQFELNINSNQATKLNSTPDIAQVFNAFNKTKAQNLVQNFEIKDQEQKATLTFDMSGFTSSDNPNHYDFFVEQPSSVSFAKPKFKLDSDKISIEFKKVQAKTVDQIKGLLLVEDSKTPNASMYYSIDTSISTSDQTTTFPSIKRNLAQQTKQSLWLMILFAFIGGAILNLMPCVFPIISLKLISLVHHQQSSKYNIRKDAGLFIAGCILCFQIIALIIVSLKHIGLSLGWGFQLQSPWFILILSFVFLVLSLSFIDLIHFELPGLSKLDQQLGKFKNLQSFYTGFLAVLLASPCSAPFMGVSLGYALTQSVLYILVIFLFLGLGFTLPYIYIFLWPKHIPTLPKSGPWLTTFKHILFFPMLATLIWLTWLYGQLQSIHHMFWLLFSLLFFASIIFIYKFKHTLARGFLYFVLALNILIGGFAFNKSLPSKRNLTTKTKKTDSLWLNFSSQTLQDHLNQNHNVFVDFTADWCVTCKVNESITFNNSQVKDFIKTNNIVMIKADWTHYDPMITDFLKNFDRASVPLYIYYHQGKDPIILPEILTPKVFMDRLAK